MYFKTTWAGAAIFVPLFVNTLGQAAYQSRFPKPDTNPTYPSSNSQGSQLASNDASVSNPTPSANPQIDQQRYLLPNQEETLVPEGQYLEALRKQEGQKLPEELPSQPQKEPSQLLKQLYPEQGSLPTQDSNPIVTHTEPAENRTLSSQLASVVTNGLGSGLTGGQSTGSESNGSQSTGSQSANSSTTDPSKAVAKTNSTNNNGSSSSTTAAPSKPAPTTPQPPKTGMDQKDGQADSLIDYALGLAGYKDTKKESTTNPTKQTSGTSGLTPTPATQSSTSAPPNCSELTTLEVCGMPESIQHEYFRYGVTVKGVLASIFNPETAKTLADNCDEGSWCLSYTEHLKIRDGMERLYLDGPLCSAAMRECLSTVAVKRRGCDDKELMFLTSTVKTLCNLSQFGLTDKGCYTSATEALYTLFVHMFPPENTTPRIPAKNFCDTFTARMSKTYLCADDACSYDQEAVLEEFEPWSDIVENATSVFGYCNMSSICPYEVEEDISKVSSDVKKVTDDYEYDYAEDYYDYGDEDTQKPSQSGTGASQGNQETQKGSEPAVALPPTVYTPVDAAPADGTVVESPVVDTSKPEEEFKPSEVGSHEDPIQMENNIFLGMIVIITLVGVVVLGLSVISYNRLRASRVASYKRGYSQLSEEERAMLRNEYN